MVWKLIGGDEKGALGGMSMCIRERGRDKEKKKMKEREWGKDRERDWRWGWGREDKWQVKELGKKTEISHEHY